MRLSRVPNPMEVIMSLVSDVILKYKHVTCLGRGVDRNWSREALLPPKSLSKGKPWGFLTKQNTPLCLAWVWNEGVAGIQEGSFPGNTPRRSFCSFSTHLCASAWHSLVSDLKSWVCRQFANYDPTRHFWLQSGVLGVASRRMASHGHLWFRAKSLREV